MGFLARLARCLPLLPVALLSAGCPLGKNDAARDVGVSAANLANPSGRDGFVRTVLPYARAHCADCHGKARTPYFAHADDGVAYEAAFPLANFAEIPGSKLVRKVKDGHCGGACTTDGKEMTQLVADWRDSFQGGAGGSVIPKGNVFTKAIPIPAATNAYKAACRLPQGLACSPDITSGTGACNNSCWVKLRFPARELSPAVAGSLSRAWFEIDFSYENYASELGSASYVFKNPRVVSPDAAVYVFDIKMFINGEYKPQYGEAYRRVDTVVDVAQFGSGCAVPAAPAAFNPADIGRGCVPSVQPLFSTAASASGVVQETGRDTVAFSFEYFQEGIVGDCRDLALFQANVFNPIKIGAVGCLGCHKAGGQISEAGQRFNIDPDDDKNGATPSARMQAICRRFLQRSNFSMPDNSPIIVQPRQGLNGMPAQENFNFFAPDWLSWIEREKALHGR